MQWHLTFLACASILISSIALARQPVSHENLAADLYEADGDVAIILLHGTMAHNRMEIISTVAGLVSEDYDFPVLAPNLSFSDKSRMGKSGNGYPTLVACDIEHRHKYFDVLDELGTWVDYLQGQGYDKVVVAGHSRGGAQVSAFLAAPNLSSAVVGGVLIAPGGSSSAEKNIASFKKNTGLDLELTLKKAKAMDPDAFINIPQFIYCEDPKVTAESFISEYEFDPRHNTLNNVPKIKVPLAIIGGSEDKIVPDVTKRFVQFQDKPGITIETVEGADHWFRDLYADDVASIVADLVDTL